MTPRERADAAFEEYWRTIPPGDGVNGSLIGVIERAIVAAVEAERAATKAAFWEEFHKSGERFFPYPDMGATEEECERVTTSSWTTFEEAIIRAGGGK